MADRRIYQLTDGSAIAGYYIPIDKSGNAEALKISTSYFVDGTHTRCAEVSVTAGANTITFSSAVPSTAYVLITEKLVDTDGNLSGGVVSNKTVNGFTYDAMSDGTFTYYTTKEI